MAFLIGLITPFKRSMGTVQQLLYGRRSTDTQIKNPPVFIIGHWRSGTTYLHELMCLDERFASPTTINASRRTTACSRNGWMNTLGSWLLPKQRPMDNMAAGWDRPQEDEFALLTLGGADALLRMAFPNNPPPIWNSSTCRVRSGRLAKFEAAMGHFVKMLTYDTREAACC